MELLMRAIKLVGSARKEGKRNVERRNRVMVNRFEANPSGEGENENVDGSGQHAVQWPPQ